MLRLSEVQNVECGAGGQLLCWLEDCKFFARKRVEVMENMARCLWLNIYTSDNVYAILATGSKERAAGCLAGSVTRRKSRPGESFVRKNKLPEGDCSLETLVRILGAILFFEAKEVVRHQDVAALPDAREVMAN